MGAALLHSQSTFDGLKQSLRHLHHLLDCVHASPRGEGVWRNLKEAWELLCAVRQHHQKHHFGFSLLCGGAQCAGCSRCCRALVGDACYGLPHLAKAGAAQRERPPRFLGLFVPDELVAVAMAARAESVDLQALVDDVKCSNHSAAHVAPTPAQSGQKHHDQYGVVVVCCPHEQARRPTCVAPGWEHLCMGERGSHDVAARWGVAASSDQARPISCLWH